MKGRGMITLNLKPLSVNRAYNTVGRPVRRNGKIKCNCSMVKSQEYKAYSKQIPVLLPSILQLPPGKLVFLVRWYFATAASDWDNPIKATQDLICDYYGVNDNKIYLAILEKNTGYKGREHIKFEFLQYHESMFDKCREAIINTD